MDPHTIHSLQNERYLGALLRGSFIAGIEECSHFRDAFFQPLQKINKIMRSWNIEFQQLKNGFEILFRRLLAMEGNDLHGLWSHLFKQEGGRIEIGYANLDDLDRVLDLLLAGTRN